MNNLFEVAFVRRGERGTPAISAYTQRIGCEFSSFVSTELKSVVWTDFRKTEEA